MKNYANPLLKVEGEGVHESYKKDANNFGNVMWRVRVKGREKLADNIPLHVSLKTFDDRSKMPHEEIKNKVQELGIQRPDPSKIKFHTSIFKAPKTGKDYYMLHLENTDPSYHHFNDHFKGQGITHPKYMAHVTLDKDLYDKINKEGIKPHEVEFGPLMIEHGADNPVHVFKDSKSHEDHKRGYIAPPIKKSEELEKGFLRNVGAALGVAGTLAASPISAKEQVPKPAMHQQQANPYSSSRMLNTISAVESNHGKYTNYKELKDGINAGERAYGKYGITPNVIRETIKMHPELKQKYGKASALHGKDIEHFMQDNPKLEEEVANKHLQRLEHHFGRNPAMIGFAWNQGIKNAYKAKNAKTDLSSHWHVKKINDAYNKEK